MKGSKTNLKRLKDLPDEKIDYSDIPETDVNFWEEAEIIYPNQKQPISIRIDQDVLEWFKKMGSGYQSKINRSFQKT